VRGRLEGVLDVLDEMEGPGVDSGEKDLKNWGDDGGDGVMEKDLCIAGIWIVGRLTCMLLEEAIDCCACELGPAALELDDACAAGVSMSSLSRLSAALASSLCFLFLSLSFCLFSIFFLSFSSSLFSATE